MPGGRLSEDGQTIILDVAFGTPVTGIWCGACLLPSGVRIPMYALADDGPSPMPWADFHECVDCGGFV